MPLSCLYSKKTNLKQKHLSYITKGAAKDAQRKAKTGNSAWMYSLQKRHQATAYIHTECNRN